MATIPKSRVAELLAQARAKAAASKIEQTQPLNLELTPTAEAINNALSGTGSNTVTTNQYGTVITYNDEQQSFIDIATKRESCILIGAAGTGKTTATKGTIETLIREVGIPPIRDANHKYLSNGTPGIVCCAYTRRAVQNIQRAMPEDMKGNCITIHKLLEYAPVIYEVEDEATGKVRNTMRFEPQRTQYNPLPESIHTIIIDEASMVSCELFAQIEAALTHNVQFIFLGDIQQLPPVFGSAILGFKMLELPTVELIQVYRQALESPIIRLAHRILSGEAIPHSEYADWHFPNQLKLHPWKKKLHADIALLTAAKFLTSAIEAGEYDPVEDMVLIPYNKAFGTEELNKHIGNFLARRSGAVTYEVIAGFNKHYFSVGDKVLYEKEDAIITGIAPNGMYSGKSYKAASTSLDYWGHEHNPEKTIDFNASDEDLDAFLEQMASADEDRTREASHVITVRLLNSDEEISVSSAAEVNNMIFGWALTVHKSQGSEFRKVFLLLHQSHNTMLQRELLYTACTRAKEELYVICEPEHFTKGILSQRIKGNTLAEKAEFFKGKVSAREQQELLQ